MKNLKTIFLSSFLTLLIVSVIFAFFYYRKINDDDNSHEQAKSELKQSESVEESSILPVNLRTQANQEIITGRQNIITNTVKKVNQTIVGINVTETRYYRDPISRDPFFRQFFGDRVYK